MLATNYNKFSGLDVWFGHGAGDPGAQSSGFQEQEMVRRLQSSMKKYADKAGIAIRFYVGNMYADNNVSWSKGRAVYELHLDSAGTAGQGGHVIIKEGLGGLDAIDKNIIEKLKENFGIVYRDGAGYDERNDLANPNRCAAAGINYRLVELFFINDAADRNYFLNNIDEVARDLISAYIGKEVGQATAAPTQPATAPTSGLAVGSKVTVRAAATHYQTGQPIASWVKGKTYTIQQVKVVNQSASKRAYLLSDIVSWVLEQDLIPFTAQTAKKPTRWINSGSTLYLPGDVSKWRVYRENGPYTVGNEVGFLNPAKFGGLTYAIKGDRMNDVVVIDTQDFGRVAIYVAKSTGATIKQNWIEVEA